MIRKSELQDSLGALQNSLRDLRHDLAYYKREVFHLTERLARQEASTAPPPAPPDHEKELLQARSRGYEQAVKDMSGKSA